MDRMTSRGKGGAQKSPAAVCGACLTAVNGAGNGFGAYCPGGPATAGQPRLIEKRDGVGLPGFFFLTR